MAYERNGYPQNNGYNRSGNGYNNGGRNGYSSNYGQSNGYGGNNGGYQQRQQAPIKKHSGAKTKKYTPTSGPNAGHQMVHTHGWMFRKKNGLVTFSCNTTAKSRLSDKGWLGSVIVEVIVDATKAKTIYWGCMEAATGKVVVNDIGLVINPKGGKGGFCGSFTNK